MRAAKRRGGDTHEIFDPRLAAPARRRLDLETELVRAVDRGQFVLHYQPVADLRDESIAGFEALVRWDHPHHGLIGPTEFIHLAEQSGAIDVLGHWVLVEACRQARSWQNGHAMDVHVNLSVHQLLNPALPDRIEAAIQEASLAPERLVLEITETALMKDVDASIAAINRVRDSGVRFAIDDFGVGYSSFAYLTRLPVQVLKLDHSLIDGQTTDMEALAVIETIVALAHRLGMTAVGEGVERPDQVSLLRRAGCDLFQGFFFGRPLPAGDTAALIA
jgi:EAL domain-containing protein (putative c-di-GMP-specific phosphodiesterase class I)